MLLDHLFETGFVLINTCTGTVSTPMTDTEIDALVDLLCDCLVSERDELIDGVVVARVKGGLSVDIGVKAFLDKERPDFTGS